MTYCCLIIGPATLEQYLDLQTSSYERASDINKNYALSEI